MKFLLAIIFAFASTAFAYDVPKDAVIKVYDASGKQIGEMSRGEYKVVKIQDKIDVRPSGQAVATTQKPVKEKESSYKLSLVLGGGVGNNGYRVETNGSEYSITDRQRPIGTLGACLTDNGAGACFTGSTNDTYLLNFLIPLGDL